MYKGFTLVELIIVMTIIGIISALSYPSFRDSLTKARRGDGQSAILDLANKLEYFYARHHSYANARIASGNSKVDVLSTKHSPEGWYELKIIHQSDTDYFIVAIPRKAQAQDDLLCQSLSYDANGRHGIYPGPSGMPRGKIEQCW